MKNPSQRPSHLLRASVRRALAGFLCLVVAGHVSWMPSISAQTTAQAAAPAATPAQSAAPAPAPAPASAPAPSGPLIAQVTSPPKAAKPADVTVSTQSAAPNRNIRFQFDGIPYSDVVERFAQMAGKPIIADTNVVGTLTYNDPNPYSYEEAIDTLNLMLSMKGVMLVEAGNNLRLVPLKELPAMPLRILRGTDSTSDVRPGEAVTVVLSISNLDLKEAADAITPMLSNAGSVAPLSRGRGLIVTDRHSNIQRARALLATIDVATTSERQMKTYNLVHASGAIISDLLNRTFGVSTAPKRTTFNPNTKAMEVLPPDPNDYITAVYDDASRILVLFGPNERLALAEELINRFEQKEGAGGDVRIYYPQSLKAEDLANMIRQAIPGVAAPNENASTSATKARVIVDPTQNRLIVAAPIPGQLEQIDTLVNRVDKGAQGTGGINQGQIPLRSQTVQLTKIFRPRATEVTNVAHIITQALTRRNPSGTLTTTASVTHDAASQSVVVSGSPGDIQIATDIVTQLETGSTQPTPMKTRFIDVGTPAEAKRILPLVEQLYRNQVSDGALGVSAHAKLMADTESGRLIVTASEDHLARIEGLVSQLRADKPQPQPRRLQILTLRNARVDVALPSIQSLLSERLSERRFNEVPKPSLIADAPNNRILATATDDQLKEIEEIVKVIDVQPETTRREMRVVALKAKTPAELIPLVNQMLEQTTPPNTNPSVAPKLMPDPSGRQVIILAIATDFDRVEKLIQQFDTSPATTSPRQFRGIDLFSRTATDLTTLVQQLYQEQLRGQPEPAGGPATLLAEPKQNRIMVSGSVAEIARVESIIRQLDPAERRAAKEETRVLRLKTASANEISGIVEKSMNAQSQQVRVMVDTRSNSLILTGDTGAVEAASQIIQQLDTRSESGPREIRVLELKSADAGTIAPMVNNLFTEMIKDQRGSDYTSTTKIVPDSVGNRLVVTGVRAEIEQVAALVQKLDNAPEQAPGARVFKLNQAEATMLAPIVTSAMLRYDTRGQPIRRVTVTADEKSNSLIVSGTRADLQDVESVIEKLDGETAIKERVLRIFDVKSDPDTLAALTQRVFAAQNPGRNTASLLNITPEPSGKRLIVLAPISQMAQVEQVILSLDAKPDQGIRELHSVELKNSTATELLPKVSQIYAEQSQGKTLKPATILPDAAGTRFLVQGTKEQAASVRQIVETLESQTRAPRETKVLELGRLSEVTRVLPLAQQLYRDQLASNPQLGSPDAQMVSDGKTGRLIVSARADQLKTIEDIVSRLAINSATNQVSRETRTLEVGTASDVQRLAPLVQQLYQDQWKDRSESDPADAQIMADPRAGRLIVTGKPEHLKQIEAILQRLGTGKAKPEARNTRILDLTTASAVELATTVRTLYLEQARGRLGNTPPDTLISPDAGGNRLILVGEDPELDAIEEIVKKLDKVSSQSASARVFKIKSAEPEKVAEILTSSLVRFDAYGRPQKRATVSVDSKTRTLIVTGDPKELQGVASIIEQLDQSLGDQPERKMRVVALKQGRSAVITPKVRQLYNDRIKTQPSLATSELLILDETDSNQLILAGTEGQLAVAEAIINELQAAQAGLKQRETKLIEMASADEMTRLLPLVQQLYRDHWKNRNAGDPADASFIPDSKNARLIVTAPTNHIAEIESILAQLRGDRTKSPDRDTRIFDLSTANAAELVTTLRTLYQEQAKNRPGAPAEDTLILPDSGANRIIVTGATAELTVVEEIIKKLDKVGTQSASTRVFKLKSADPEKVVEILGTALVRYDAFGRPQKRVSVVTDVKTRTLIATGDPKELQSAAVIIEQLDSSLGTQGGRTMRVINVKNRRVSELGSKVRQIYNDQAKNQPELGASEALILEDTPSNQLILAGTEKQLTAIEEIAIVLQKDGADTGRVVRVVPLERGNASSIVTMLSNLYARQIASTDPTDRLVVSSGGNERSLVIDAPTATAEKVEQLVKSLDVTEGATQNIVQTIRLNKGRAEDLADAVNRIMTNRSGVNFGRRINVTAVNGANSLLINGPTNLVQDVMKIVRELDQDSTGGDIEVRIYKLENGNAKEVSSVLEQLLRNVTRRNRGDSERPQQQASISVDDRSNSLIISGTPVHFRLVEKILPTLDKAPERSDRDVQFVWLRKARAFDVVSKLETLFEDRPRSDRPVIEPDSTNNSLTIIARRGDIPQIQDLVNRLDEQSKDGSIQVRLRPLERVAADQMAHMLQNIYPQMASATLRVVDRVDMPKLTPVPGGSPVPPSNPTTPAPAPTPAPNPANPAPAPNGNPAPGATPTPAANTPPAQAVVQPASTNAVPEVTIAIDKTANALILAGPSQELDHVERLISDLSLNFYGNEAEFRLFPLKDADPVVVARALGELLKQEPIQVQGSQALRTIPQQPKITVVAETRTRSVIVRARPTDFGLMESLIKQLDAAGQSSQIEYRVVALTNAPPEKVLPLVQQMVTQLTTSRPGEPLTVAAAPRARGILVVGRGTALEQIEKMVHSLDTAAPNVEAEVLMVQLKKANANQLAVTLQNMLKPGTQGESTPEARELQEQVRRLKVTNDQGKSVLLDLSQPIKIAADGTTGGGNRLVITSTPDNLKALAAIAESMDSSAIVEGVEVRMAVLRFADAATVSQTLTTIFTQGRQLATGPGGPAAQPEGETGKALTNPFNVAIDTRSNTLVMSGRKETLDLATKVIGDLDKQLERFVTEVKLFRLKHASALRMLPMLQSVFAEGPPVPGTEGLNTQITRLRVLKDNKESTTTLGSKTRTALTIQADDVSNILIVAARSDTLPLIQEVIEQMDIPSASGLETVRIYPLEHSDPAVIQKILTDLYNGQRPGNVRNEDKPVISIDARTSALVVAGNGKSFAMIEGLLKQLDQKLPFELRDIRMIPLQNADANVVAATIQKLMDARITQRASLNQGTADTLKVIVMADQRSNALLVGGSKDSFELVESLAKQLDTASPALSGRIRLIPLQFADARVIATTFTSLFEQRYAAARTADVQRQKPIIMADMRSNSLLVTANQEDNGAIDDLLKRLDAKQENPALTLTVLGLKHNDSARVGTMLETIFAARLRAQTLPGQQPLPNQAIKIEPDALNNALVISASKENLDLIQELVQKLDAEPTIPGGTLETFTLQFADAQRIATILKSLVDQGLYRPGLPPGAPVKGNSARDVLSISVDPRSNTLIVSASPENLSIVREVIKKVDNKDLAATGDVRLYPLKNAKASSLATILEQFFRAKRTADSLAVNANERIMPVSVLADDRINTLLVTGGKEAFELVDRILPQLDGEPVFSRLNFRVFPLKRATATKLQSTLQPIFANRPPKVKGEPVDPITIVADAWVNALLVGATVDDLATVASLVAQLDAEPTETGIAIHVFPLAKADARRVAQTVQGLFREPGPNQILPISISADERINALVVSCGETDAKRIQELVQKLDTEQVARVSEIRVFPLQYAKAEALSSILNTSLNNKPTGNLTEQNPNAQSVLQFITRTSEGRELVTAALKEAVLITPDSRMNSLIVSGPVDYMSLLDQIITRLDMNSPQQAKIKVFTLQNADARQMSELLMQLFRMSQSQTTIGTQRAVQYTLVRPRTDDAGNALEDVSLGSATVGTAEQHALTVTIDPRTNSLLVGGTDHYVTLVSQIIETLDASPANERKSEVVRLKNSQAQEVGLSIRTFLDQERQRVTQVLGADAIGTAQRMLEREVAVVPEPVSNTLLVSANPRYFEQIRELINELDKAQPQVLIQVLLAEVTLDSLTDLGVEWNYSGSKGDVKYGTGTDFGVPKQLQDFGGYSTAITGSDFNFMLRALKDQGRLEVLSRPQIVTADNKPAAINIGQRVPLITDSRVTERGDTINSFRYEDVGVNLTVTPKISPDGFVKMEIGTTNSALSSSSVEVNKSATVPIINQRRANTTVSVQSGQTIIIGGLIATLDDRRVKKVPVLGSIPYLGALFRSTHTSRERKELLILLTPQVLNNTQTPVPLQDLQAITRGQVQNSIIGETIQRDRLQKQIMDPIFPTNRPPNSPKHDPLRL